VNIRKILVAASLSAASLAPFATRAGIAIDINTAPPAPQVEEVPPPRAGYVWAPGYWMWSHGHHVWRHGHWIRARRGSHWVPDAWETHGDRYHYNPGHWERG